MSARRWLLCLTMVLWSAATPLAGAAPTPTPKPSPAEVSDLSAQHAEVERGKIYGAGVAYSELLDRAATASGSSFLQQRLFDRVTWMRLLACLVSLALLAALAGGLLIFVRRKAGAIDSSERQSWPALAAAAARKPLALFIWVVGGFLAFMPIVSSISSRPTRDFFANALTAILYAGRVIAVFWLLYQAVRAIEKKMRHWAANTGSVLNSVFVSVAGQTLRLAVPLLAVLLLLPLLDLPASWAWVTQKAFGILLIVSLAFLIVRGVRSIQTALLREHRMDVADNYSARRIYTQVSVIRKLITSLVVFLGIAAILMMFDAVRQFGASLLASAGIAGIILGFAAQKTLGNLLAGIQIALSQPILIDDVVIVEGESGRIEDITLTFVVVRTWDLRRLIVPITYFIEKPFQNWSRHSDEILGTVFLYLDYYVPLGEVRAELKRLVEKNENWDRKVCGLQVTDTKPHMIEVRALMSSFNASQSFDLRCQVREGLIEFLRSRFPESLPRVRIATEALQETAAPETPHSSQVEGAEHERGDAAPGLRSAKE